MKDLFDTPELIPTNVEEILNTFDESEDGYKECERIKKELNEINYDFDYGLDAIPFDLHRTDLLNTMKKVINELGERSDTLHTDVVEFIFKNKDRIGDGIINSELWNNKVADILGYYLMGEEEHEKFNKLNLHKSNKIITFVSRKLKIKKMKKLILSLLFAITLNVNLQSQTCQSNFIHSASPTNPLVYTFTQTCTYPTGSFNYKPKWSFYSTVFDTVNSVTSYTFASSGTFKIKLYFITCIGSGIYCWADTSIFITVSGISTGIKDHLKNDNSILVYPNPTNGLVTIKLTEGDLNKKYSIINLMGQTILTGEFKDLHERIDLSILSSGIYILTSEKKVVKIMKD